MKHNLTPTGLSLSQAQSISNLCFQRAQEITNKLSGINNASRTVKVNGETYEETVGKPMPDNLTELLLEKAKLHAAQAFLMSNIKMKDELLKQLRMKPFTTLLEEPSIPNYTDFRAVPMIGEDFGWEQLSSNEFSEYLEAEAYAAHIGQFIHKGGILDELRKELPGIKTLDWMEITAGVRTPIVVAPHHTSEQLLNHHEALAVLHRKYEQRVNYYKAKVKNLVTEENARISRENADKIGTMSKENELLRASYISLFTIYQEAVRKEKEAFEAKRQDDTKLIAALRISVDPRFQDTVDAFLKDLDSEA